MKKSIRIMCIVLFILGIGVIAGCNKVGAASTVEYAEVKIGEKTESGTLVTVTFNKTGDIVDDEKTDFENKGWTVNKNVLTRNITDNWGFYYLKRMKKTSQSDDKIIEIAMVALPIKLDKGKNEFYYISDDFKSKFNSFNIVDKNVAEITKKDGKDALVSVNEGKTQMTGEYIGSAAVEGNSTFKWDIIVIDSTKTPEYELIDNSTGKNDNLVEIGKVFGPELVLRNKTTLETKTIDKNNLKLEVSNSDIIEKDGLTIKAKSEGIVTLNYTYTEDGKEYKFSKEYRIYDPEKEFSVKEFPLMSTSKINISANSNGVSLFVVMTKNGDYEVQYPAGYTKDMYYKYQWGIDDMKIAKYEKISDTEIKIIPVAKGSTKVRCIVSTNDGKEVIEKVIEVNVGDAIDNKDENKDNGENKDNNENKEDNENKDGKSNEDLPKAGEKSSIVFMITLLIVVSIIMFRKSRNLKIK